MTSENSEEIFELKKDDITKQNTKLRELVPPRLFVNRGIIQGNYTRVMFMCIILPTQMNSSIFASFCTFVVSIFSSLSPLCDFPTRTSYKKTNHLI